MINLLSLVKDYIQHGKVSISSTDVIESYIDERYLKDLEEDTNPESQKVHFGSEMIKLYHMNQCLFYAKGLAKYVGIWDMDELLIPQNKTESFPNAVDRILDQAYNEHIHKVNTEILVKKETQSGLLMRELTMKGSNVDRDRIGVIDDNKYAQEKKQKDDEIAELSIQISRLERQQKEFDIHQHFCFMKFLSYSHMAPESKDLQHYMGNRKDHLWHGQVFHNRKEQLSDDTWKKAILATKHIYYTGYHLPGACLSKDRNWDKIVGYEDAIHVDDKDLAMFHFRNKLSTSGIMKTNTNVSSEYVQNGYFQRVLRGLKSRGIERKIFQLCDV